MTVSCPDVRRPVRSMPPDRGRFRPCLALLRVNGRNNAVDHELIVRKFCPKRLRAKWPWWTRLFMGVNNHFDGEIKRRNKTADIALPRPASSSAVPWSTDVRIKAGPA